MPIYVWQGEKVLKNYRSGLVVISAPSEEAAWTLLSQHDADAYWLLKTGRRLHAYGGGLEAEDTRWAIQNDEENDGGLNRPEDGFPVLPQEFDPAALPPLVSWGGE